MHKSNLEPGVSGKTIHGKSWFNSDKYHEQKDFMEDVGGENLSGRTDLSNQGINESHNVKEDEVFEALKRSPGVDVAQVQVEATNGVITLSGTAASPKEARAMIKIVENISGVSKVVNNLTMIEGAKIESSDRG